MFAEEIRNRPKIKMSKNDIMDSFKNNRLYVPEDRI